MRVNRASESLHIARTGRDQKAQGNAGAQGLAALHVSRAEVWATKSATKIGWDKDTPSTLFAERRKPTADKAYDKVRDEGRMGELGTAIKIILCREPCRKPCRATSRNDRQSSRQGMDA
jgi:hypothetical protein